MISLQTTKRPNQVYSFTYPTLHHNLFVSFMNHFYQKSLNYTIFQSSNNQYFHPSQPNCSFQLFVQSWLSHSGSNPLSKYRILSSHVCLKFWVSVVTSSNSKHFSTRSALKCPMWFAHTSKRKISHSNSSSRSKKSTTSSRFLFNAWLCKIGSKNANSTSCFRTKRYHNEQNSSSWIFW